MGQSREARTVQKHPVGGELQNRPKFRRFLRFNTMPGCTTYAFVANYIQAKGDISTLSGGDISTCLNTPEARTREARTEGLRGVRDTEVVKSR
jgi:hypothetical protein